MPPSLYIWISRWEEFQHYKPRRDRGPKWIKQHTPQLHDDRYLSLTDRQRALLHDLRMMFATFRGRLPRDARMISRQRNSQTRDADLDALNHAGYIDVCSRETLDQRLEKFYSRSSPEVEVEKEEEKNPSFLPTSQVDEEQEGRAEIQKRRQPTEAEIVDARELGYTLEGYDPPVEEEDLPIHIPSPFQDIPL